MAVCLGCRAKHGKASSRQVVHASLPNEAEQRQYDLRGFEAGCFRYLPVDPEQRREPVPQPTPNGKVLATEVECEAMSSM